MSIVRIPELYTDGITESGLVRGVRFHLRVIHDDGRDEWHYFGTEPPPERPDAIQHSEVRFPADFFNLPELADLLYDLGLEVALERICPYQTG